MPRLAVNVSSKTWTCESYDLFDFESDRVTSDTFSVRGSRAIVRNSRGGAIRAEGASRHVDAVSLLRIVEKSGGYWVDRATSEGSHQRLWTVVRDMPGPGQRLGKDDIIRLGRCAFRVRQIVAEPGAAREPDLDTEATAGSERPCRSCAGDDLEGKVCRICLMEGSSSDDPLLRPCKCAGSIERVHLGCLRTWTKSRLNLEDAPRGSYSFAPVSCELCKTTFPTYIESATGQRTRLMSLPKTPPPYIVLESEACEGRRLHVLSLAERPQTLGRGHESDVHIANVSISRCHASIAYFGGRIFLQDHGSKFGTLVAMRRPRQLDASAPLSVQVGQTVLALSVSAAEQGADPPAPPAAVALVSGVSRSVAEMTASTVAPQRQTPTPRIEQQSVLVAGEAADAPGSAREPVACTRYRLSI